MIREDSDIALLRVLECFLEAAPQQILQMAIIFSTHGRGVLDESNPYICKYICRKQYKYNLIVKFLDFQLLSIGSSFASMAWSMASYHRLIRVSLINKNNISWGGTAMQFMWHFLVTG